MSELAIETVALSRCFGRLRAVDQVDLRVPAGSIYGYLGRNGAGKTTTIQMLMGLLCPTSGSLSVMGLNPFRREVAMKRIVSYVPERVHLPEWMTVSDLMHFGAGAHPRWDAALAEHLRQRLDLPKSRRLRQFSRGMQGKTALLLALASRPRLLILDDPTMGLDVVVRREFMENLILILQETGVTVFFSSHQLDDVERLADWIGLLHEGRLILQRPLDQLQQSVRRLVAVFPDGAAAPAELPDMLQHEQDGRQHLYVVANYSDVLRQTLREAGAASVQVEHLTLEDIFVAYVRPHAVRAVDLPQDPPPAEVAAGQL